MIELAADPQPARIPTGQITERQSEEGKEVVLRVIHANEWRLRRIEAQMMRNEGLNT